jgi:sugar-specific transcriptional regulator TrmB
MEKNHIFSHLGLGDNEALVYQTLISFPCLSVAEIAKKTSLYRPSVYRTLATLSQKHLVVTTPKGKRVVYSAESPDSLKDLLFERFAFLEDEIALLEKKFSRSHARKKTSVRLLEGEGAIAQAILAIPKSLKTGDVYYRYSARDIEGPHTIPKKILHAYAQKREAKKLERYVITGKKNYEQKHDALDREIKIVPPEFDLFQQNVSQIIYGNTILLLDYNEETALVIENPALAEFQKKIFLLLFRLLPKPPKN